MLIHLAGLELTLCPSPPSRINTLVIVVTVLSYLAQPMVAGNNGTPTLISINGTTDWSLSVYCLIYASQAIYAFSVLFSMGAYDAIFIQCIMVLLFRFRTMSHILRLLDESGYRSPVEDKEILVDVYKMQLDVLGCDMILNLTRRLDVDPIT